MRCGSAQRGCFIQIHVSPDVPVPDEAGSRSDGSHCRGYPGTYIASARFRQNDFLALIHWVQDLNASMIGGLWDQKHTYRSKYNSLFTWLWTSRKLVIDMIHESLMLLEFTCIAH
jgi:hypothetical protein